MEGVEENAGASGTGLMGVDEDGRTREERIVTAARFVVGYKFDERGGRWCEIKLQVSLFFSKLYCTIMMFLCALIDCFDIH